MTNKLDFDEGRQNGERDRLTFDNLCASYNEKALVSVNRRKAAIGVNSEHVGVRSYWLGWLAGFDID